LLFASAVGKDKELVANRKFQSSMTEDLQACFMGCIPGYARDIRAYVHPWSKSLADITVTTHIWQGAADNWSPPLMASYLKLAIPSCSDLEILDELSHYSCLYKTVSKICQQLSKNSWIV
jgi:pimeloyl-ACP methyl ester carboxylesterase